MQTILNTCLLTGLYAQTTYTVAFTKQLAEANIQYALPAETWFHVIIPEDDGFMKYDLVLEEDNQELEIRYVIHEQGTSPEIPPSVEVAGLIANIASNDPETEIRIQIPSDEFLRTHFNASKGIAALFVPKEDFSFRHFGAFLRLYSDSGKGIDIILLYDDPDYSPLDLYRSIWFTE